MHRNLLFIYYFEQLFPDMGQFSSKIFKLHFRIMKRTFESLAGNRQTKQTLPNTAMKLLLLHIDVQVTNSEVLGLSMGQKGQMDRSFLIGPIQLRKVVHLKGWPTFLKLFRLDRAEPFSFTSKFPEILVNGTHLLLRTRELFTSLYKKLQQKTLFWLALSFSCIFLHLPTRGNGLKLTVKSNHCKTYQLMVHRINNL